MMESRVRFYYSDGRQEEIDASNLQLSCPCARCQGKEKKELGVPLSVSMVGRYAFKIAFSKGCSQGIYPL